MTPDNPTEVCTWTEEDPWGPTPQTWGGTCEVLWTFGDGGPKDHEMNFCLKCGKPLVAVPWKDEPEEGEDE